MTHYDVFRGQLAIKYPAYGHALWEPSLSESRLRGPVEVGDVGFIREGRFHRLFNALLSMDHPSYRSGVSECHEPLPRPLIPKLSDHIIYGPLSPGHCCSDGTDITALERDVQVTGPDDCPQAPFSCNSRRRGAVPSLPVPVQRQDTLAPEAFGKWMMMHFDPSRWFTSFARQHELGTEQTEKLVLVTGCDRVRSWTNVAFLKTHAQVSIGVEVTLGPEGGISWQVSPEKIRGVVLIQGPSGNDLPENLCIFTQDFRAACTPVIFPKHLRAAAEFSTDAGGYDGDSEADVELISTPTVSKVPLPFLLDYVAGRTPECDMLHDHDDDLARISGICDSDALETLQPDVVENHLQGSNAEMHTDLCHLPPAKNGDPRIVRVAICSMITRKPSGDANVSPQSPSTPLTSQNVGPHCTAGLLAINLQANKGWRGDPPSLLDGADIGDYAQNITPSHLVISVDVPQALQPISLLQIPPELVTRILSYLSPLDIISCARTCQTLHDLCNASALQYLVQMERCSVSDDLSPGLSYPERLRIVKEREEAWEMLDFRKSIKASVPFKSSGMYDLTGGAFFLDCGNHGTTTGYSYITLPSLSNDQDQKLEWKEFSLETKMLNFGLAVDEHDMIAVLTAQEDVHHPSGRNMILQLHLLSISTGQYHPLAEQPIIFIAAKSLPLGICNVVIEIAGNFLVLLITFLEEWTENDDMFFVVLWKTGKARCLCSPKRGTYIDFTFLSQDTFVIPNLRQNTVEVTKIVIDSDGAPCLMPLCTFHLPPLTRDASLCDLYCHTEPNPTSSGTVAISSQSHRPFHDKAEDAIVIFDISYGHSSGRNWLTFVVHRRSLLAHIPAAHRACAPFCSAPEPVPTLVHVPWSAWGPATTRCFEGERAATAWITRTAGQRMVALKEAMPTPIIVRDFNPYAVRAARALAAVSGQLQQGNWSKQLSNGNRVTLKMEDSVLNAGFIFEEDVRSSLPYVETVTEREYHYTRAMIDDQRILCLESNPEAADGIWYFDIHVLG